MWDLPGPGLEPVSPALAGGFLTTAPPGKPHDHILNFSYSSEYVVVSHCDFNLHFYMTSNGEYLFMCLLAIYVSS